MWEHFHHQADIGVRGRAESVEAAFEEAAAALTAVVCDIGTVEGKEAVEIECGAADAELLLVDWLNAIIYEMDTRRMLFSKFEVKIEEGKKLQGKAWGERIDEARHEMTVEVKAATYMMLKVEQDRDGMWLAQCVVDV